jgi:hypothetical protein
MKITFKGDTLTELVTQMDSFMADATAAQVVVEVLKKPKTSKAVEEIKTKATKPEPKADPKQPDSVPEQPPEESLPEIKGPVSNDTMRELTRDKLMQIYMSDNGRTFTDDLLKKYKVSSLVDLPEENVAEVYAVVEAFETA